MRWLCCPGDICRVHLRWRQHACAGRPFVAVKYANRAPGKESYTEPKVVITPVDDPCYVFGMSAINTAISGKIKTPYGRNVCKIVSIKYRLATADNVLTLSPLSLHRRFCSCLLAAANIESRRTRGRHVHLEREEYNYSNISANNEKTRVARTSRYYYIYTHN